MRIHSIKAALFFLLGAFAVNAAWAQLPDGAGKDTVMQVCGKCHDPEIVKGYHQDKGAWSHVISQMIDQGAEGTDDQFNAILAYLAKNFGPALNVNKATAKDLETQLELTAKESEAIVKYRDDKGPFKEIADLKAVPDLDYKKIEAKKDRLTF
jgi:competence protein ComEA